ncbi:MAG: hypothetical protein ABIO70_32040 [Pseudomonadota bacterium]
MRHLAPKILLVLLSAGWLLGKSGPVPRSIEWQLLPTDGKCRQVGRSPKNIVNYAWSGDFAQHEHVEFVRHAGSATLTVTEWGLPDDATSAWRAVYHLEDTDAGMKVVDCAYEHACWRTPLGLGVGSCP